MKHVEGFAFLAALVVVLGADVSASGQSVTMVNPVQVEMRLLSDAMRTAVDGIAAGDVRRLPAQLHAVHLAAGDTRSAIEKGEYMLPAGADQLESFLALDEAFHRDLIKMVQAAKSNDVAATAEHFGALMNRCHGCHEQFRIRHSATE